MDKERFYELLDDYVDGRLEGKDREAFERALDEDPALRAEFDADREIVALLRDSPRSKAPATLRGRIVDRLREEMAAKEAVAQEAVAEAAAVGTGVAAPSRPSHRRFWDWIADLVPSRPAQVALATCAVAAVVLVTAILPRTLTPRTPTAEGRLSRVAMDGVDRVDKVDKAVDPAKVQPTVSLGDRDLEPLETSESGRMVTAGRESRPAVAALPAAKPLERQPEGEPPRILAAAAGEKPVLKNALAAPSPSPAPPFAGIREEEPERKPVAVAGLPAGAVPSRDETRLAVEMPAAEKTKELALAELASNALSVDLSQVVRAPQPAAEHADAKRALARTGGFGVDRDEAPAYGTVETEDRAQAGDFRYLGAPREETDSSGTELVAMRFRPQPSSSPSSPTVATVSWTAETRRPKDLAFSAGRRMSAPGPVEAKKPVAAKSEPVETAQAALVMSMDLYLQSSRVVAAARRPSARREVSGGVPGLTPGIAPSGVGQRVAPAPLSLGELEKKLRDVGFDTRYDEKTSTLFCSIRGRDAQWVMQNLTQIGLKVASLTRGGKYLAVSERDSLAEAREIFKDNPRQKGFAFVTGYGARKAGERAAASGETRDVPLLVQIRVRYLNVAGSSD